MKKIALCSPVVNFTNTFANKLMSRSGVWPVSFGDVVEEWLTMGGKLEDKRARPLEFIMPSLEYLNRNYADMAVVNFGADTLIHNEALREIKKDYEVVFLRTNETQAKSNEMVEDLLQNEYKTHLEKIADVVVDCNDVKKAVREVSALLKK